MGVLQDMQAVLFDLDGTLVDTLPDIAWCLNRVLALHRLPGLPDDQVRALIGGGVAAMIDRVSRLLDVADRERLYGDYKNCYREHLVRLSRPYSGIVQLLETIQLLRLPMVVVTNKEQALAVDMVGRLLPAGVFRKVIGNQPGLRLKPAPDLVLQAARLLRVAPGSCLYVGDTAIDMFTAQAAGMPMVAAGWGYGEPNALLGFEPYLFSETPHALLETLCLLAPVMSHASQRS